VAQVRRATSLAPELRSIGVTSSSIGRVRIAAAGIVILLALSGCAEATSVDRTIPSTARSTPATKTATEQRDVVVNLVRATESTSAARSWNGDVPYPQSCALPNGTTGAQYNVTKRASAVTDPESTVKVVGADWEKQGLHVRSTTETLNGVTQYQVFGTSPAIQSISFRADRDKSYILAVSACGTGDEKKLSGG
jgi:hypothetical protein